MQVAVGADAVGPVVDDGVAGAVELGGQPALGDGHADGVGEALAERAGGRLDARRVRPYSGWPGVFEPSWRKRLSSSSGRS